MIKETETGGIQQGTPIKVKQQPTLEDNEWMLP